MQRPSAFHEGKHFSFPLQYEPGSLLLLMPPLARNQVRRSLKPSCSSLRNGKLLWVQGAPQSASARLSRSDMARAFRRSLSNLRLIFGRENGRHLIQRCKSGNRHLVTAGLDALIFAANASFWEIPIIKDFRTRCGSGKQRASCHSPAMI